jgi:hypothetical protein
MFNLLIPYRGLWFMFCRAGGLVQNLLHVEWQLKGTVAQTILPAVIFNYQRHMWLRFII